VFHSAKAVCGRAYYRLAREVQTKWNQGGGSREG